MPSDFRDSFTKADAKDDLLGYDDTAFCYFVITVSTCIAIPWTLSTLSTLVLSGKAWFGKECPTKSASGSALRYCQTSAMIRKVHEVGRRSEKSTRVRVAQWSLRCFALVLIWVCTVGTGMRLGYEKEINKFDPFEILGVVPRSTRAQLKAVYRRLSLAYHPDRNHDDPMAAARFIQITKAYQALTDEVARRNYERFGNPDGPQSTKVGIGLPRCLLEKEHSLVILCTSLSLMVVVVPVAFLCYFRHLRSFAANGVMLDSLQLLGYWTTESTRVHDIPELVAACAESRAMSLRPADIERTRALRQLVSEHSVGKLTPPVVVRNQLLLWAHMQRAHSHLHAESRDDCATLIAHAMRLTQAMVEIACMREWFSAASAAIDFRRRLVQAMDLENSGLLQVPHFDDALVCHCAHQSPPVATLADFFARDVCFRKRLPGITGDQLADVEAFCSHVGLLELEAIVGVDDEDEIVVGDVATVSVRICRPALREHEAMGPVHAPLFPGLKFEEWWLFLVEADPGARVIHFEWVRSTERVVEERLRFQVTKAGANNVVLHALCDSYLGLDKKVELQFHALSTKEHARRFVVHEEDRNLDLQSSFFQQAVGDIGDFNPESDEEEEEDERKPEQHGGASRGGKVDGEEEENSGATG